jgi:hypothetical protein
MNLVGAWKASDAEGRSNPLRRYARLFSISRTVVAAAILISAIGLNITSRAYAQTTQSPADCVAKCKADEKQCLNNGSSEELCDYDSKACQRACTESK